MPYYYYTAPVALTMWQTICAFIVANMAIICTILGIAWTASSVAMYKLISDRGCYRLTAKEWLAIIFAPLLLGGASAKMLLQLTGEGVGYVRRKLIPAAEEKKMLDNK